MLDINLLRVMKVRKDYMHLIPVITKEALGAETKIMLKAYEKYFTKFEDHSRVRWDLFVPRFRAWNTDMSEAHFAQFAAIIKQAAIDCDEGTRNGLMQDLQEIGLATKVANLAEQYAAGDLPDIAEHIGEAVSAYRLSTGIKLARWIDDDINRLLQDEMNQAGLKWRLAELNRSMRPLRDGDFGIVAARPDKGKTTLLASEATFMASQLPKDQNILWLNNEGLGTRIVPRLYQAALGIKMPEMLKMSSEGTLVDAYRNVVGRLDRIRVTDIHGWQISHVESVIEQSNAGLVIFDMVDNIRGFGNESRTDLVLERMYQRVRELCVKYKFAGLATSQISNDGDGEMFPTLGMLKDSKTGKQGSCDFQLMIGSSNDPNLQSARWLSLPKNKLRTSFGAGDPRAEVAFKPMIARYEDIT